jgi:glucose-1-phosphate adenylyltransferase
MTLHEPPAKFVFLTSRLAHRDRDRLDGLRRLHRLGGRIHRTVMAPRTRINSYSHVEECILLEGVNVGRHARIRRAIVDKDVDVPAGTEIGYDLEADRKRFFVSEGGIVVVPKGTQIR